MPTVTKKTPSLPEPFRLSYQPLALDDPGHWLVLSDLHVPYHEPSAVEAALTEGKRHKLAGILLNGDVLDFHELSKFDKDPTMPRYREERQSGLQLLRYLRYRFPNARIVYKEGNHEERLPHFLMRHAQALFGLDLLSLPSILEFASCGIEHVGDRRVIRLGHLNVIHGHEYRPNIQAPVNPARGLFLRAKSNAVCGHFHQPSEHNEPTLTGKSVACWSTGCLCQLTPQYMPLNKWSWGFAMVEVARGGNFSVRNLKLIDGKVV